MDIKAFWRAVLAQDEPEIRAYFAPDAYVNWHCTNEHFTVDEFITANCEYPGDWDGVVERIETLGGLTVTVTRVYPKDRSCSFHVTSFLRTETTGSYRWMNTGPTTAARRNGETISTSGYPL